MWSWTLMAAVGVGMAVTIILQKSSLNHGAGWPSVSLSHNIGVWLSLAVILPYMMRLGHQISVDAKSLIGGIITGITATISIVYLARHSTGQTMIAIRASASIFVLLLGYLVLDETHSVKQWVGFVLIILGTLLL